MNKTKIRKLRQQSKLKEHQKSKSEKILDNKKMWLLEKRKELKLNKPIRSKKFFDSYFSSMNEHKNSNNSEIPSLITDKWGKCTKKKSPLDY